MDRFHRSTQPNAVGETRTRAEPIATDVPAANCPESGFGWFARLVIKMQK
jgi:hypothetical protein